MVGEGMLIYILHNDKFYTFRLPKNVFGDYVLHDFDSNDFKRNLVNVSSIDGSWYINSNMNVKIMVNNQFVENCKLENYSYYMLVTNQNERILVYCMPGYDNSYVAKNINADGTIIVGRNNACDVVFNSLNISDKQLELTLKNLKKMNIIDDTFKLEDYESIIMDPAYVHIDTENDKKVEEYKKQLATNNIYTIGRYGGWTYCSMEDCMLEAKELFERIK